MPTVNLPLPLERQARRAASRHRSSAFALTALAMLAAVVSAGCDLNMALHRVADARRLASDLLAQFTRAADAGNRAVMADTDEASVAFAREARQAGEAVRADADSLTRLLAELRFEEEAALLKQFDTRFAEYHALEATILDLAVENTNLKAQRLSHTSARESADAFRDALERVLPRDPAESWHVKALAASALASVRDIQALQAPHIAEPDDAVMTDLEKQMAKAESAARKALEALAGLIGPASGAPLAAAVAALDRLMALNAEIVALSRRNTNVRSLALAMNQKRAVTVKCEESLHALRDALAKRGFTGTR
jgi:hypothetical protein